MSNREQLQLRLIQYLIDTISIVGGMWLASYLRINLSFGISGPDIAFTPPAWLYIVAFGIWFFVFHETDVYEIKYEMRPVTKVQQLIIGNLMAAMFFLGLLYIFYRDYSRLQTFYFVVIVFSTTGLSRLILYLLYARFRWFMHNSRHVLIIGTNENARRIGERLLSAATGDLTLLGYLKFYPEDEIIDGISEHVLGGVESLENIVREYNISEVVIAFKWYDQHISNIITKIMNILHEYPINIRVAPDYTELAYFRLSTENFSGVPLIGLRELIFSPSQQLIKRLFDIAVSALIIALGSPIFIGVAIAIRLDTSGPIVFGQKRIGMHGREFKMFKFRSMYEALDQSNFDETLLNVIKEPDDPRVTRVGRFLRRTSLDELPQFFNVLRGDMSIVGPRPELPHRVQYYEWWQRKRFEVPQGMTGWWQVNGRANRPMHLNTEDDLFYIKNYSLWLDIRIIFRTVFVVITGDGAF